MNITRRKFLQLTCSAFLASQTLPGFVYGMNVKVPVLVYHEVTHLLKGDYVIPPDDFASQMEWLYFNGYKTVFVKDLYSVFSENYAKIAVITFDDGSLTFIDYAFPVLKEYGFKVTINLVGSWINSKKQVLSWDECRYLKSSGFVDFGCHSYNFHNSYDGYLSAGQHEIDRDMKKFNENLFKELGETTKVLAWPFGRYNKETIQIAKSNGFKYLLTSLHGYLSQNADFFVIPRINIGDKITINAFKQIIEGK